MAHPWPRRPAPLAPQDLDRPRPAGGLPDQRMLLAKRGELDAARGARQVVRPICMTHRKQVLVMSSEFSLMQTGAGQNNVAWPAGWAPADGGFWKWGENLYPALGVSMPGFPSPGPAAAAIGVDLRCNLLDKNDAILSTAQWTGNFLLHEPDPFDPFDVARREVNSGVLTCGSELFQGVVTAQIVLALTGDVGLCDPVASDVDLIYVAAIVVTPVAE